MPCTVGGRIARAAFQYTLQDPNIGELTEWAGKMLARMRTLPEIVDVGTDLLFSAPQLKVTINHDNASRFGICRSRLGRPCEEANNYVAIGKEVPAKQDQEPPSLKYFKNSAR